MSHINNSTLTYTGSPHFKSQTLIGKPGTSYFSWNVPKMFVPEFLIAAGLLVNAQAGRGKYSEVFEWFIYGGPVPTNLCRWAQIGYLLPEYFFISS